MSTFRILCIDGGGIRGIIPAMVLAEIERRTGRRISQLFDLIAGTSTGGILALGLVKPGKRGRPDYTAEDLVQLYEKQGRRIFSRSVLHQLVSLNGLAQKKYQSGPVEKVFEETFGDVLLSQALTNVMLTSFDIKLRDAFFFRSYRAKANEYNYLMRHAARSTSAAPTYFAPELVPNGDEDYALIDGGVFANNPAMCALVDAMSEFGKDLNDIFMVSIGTGSEIHRPLEFQKAKNWGVVGWARPILTIVFKGISDTVDYQSKLILSLEGGGQQRYHRLQLKLPTSLYKLDNVTAKNICSLKEYTEEFIETSEKDIGAICKALKAPRRRKRAA